MSLVLQARKTLIRGLLRFLPEAPVNEVATRPAAGVRLSGIAVEDLQLHGEKFGLGVMPGVPEMPGIGPVECLVFGGFCSAAVDIKPIELRVRDGKVLNADGDEAHFDEARVLRRSMVSRCTLPLIWCVVSRRNGVARSKSGVMVVCGSARYLAMVISREFAKGSSQTSGA